MQSYSNKEVNVSIVAPTACLNASSSIDDPPYRGVTETDKYGYGYVPVYENIARILGPSAKVCELGVASGYSLELWQELFPQGTIAGVDINPSARWPSGTRRIVCSQDDQDLPEILGGKWDLIVDDCSHDWKITSDTLDNLWPLVSPGGYYVIENIVLIRFYEENDPKWFNVNDKHMAELTVKLLRRLSGPTDTELLEYRGSLVTLKKTN